MPPPDHPKLYHIVHVDCLPSILADGHIWCDREVLNRAPPGVTIGMNNIKKRRLDELTLDSHPELFIGDCVPFYFCPRSIMLYMIYVRSDELSYKGGQGPIVHLEFDMNAVVNWANQIGRKWAFTLSNAGSYYVEDRSDLTQLDEIDWDAVNATSWQRCKDGKQAEFLMQFCVPWELVSRIGVHSRQIRDKVGNILIASTHKPAVEALPSWYY